VRTHAGSGLQFRKLGLAAAEYEAGLPARPGFEGAGPHAAFGRGDLQQFAGQADHAVDFFDRQAGVTNQGVRIGQAPDQSGTLSQVDSVSGKD
jgi:hypothetical protein